MTVRPQYLLAMKVMSMSLGEEFRDLEDVRFLIRYLNLTERREVDAVLNHYYSIDQYPTKGTHAIDAILDDQ